MVGTVIQGDLDIHYREAGDNAVFHLFRDAFAHCRNVFLRNHTTDNFIDEFETGTRLLRFNSQPDLI